MSKIGKDGQRKVAEDTRVREQRRNYGVDDEVAAATEAARVLDFIERHLFESLTVTRIARECHVSAFHFSRRFSARQGESLMAYVRGRRLEIAADKLRADPHVPLAAVALDCGFESQAAFTRAFTRAFGAAPGEYRSSRSTHGRKRRMSVKLQPVLHESVEEIGSLRVAGLSGRFDPSSYVRIADLWKSVVGVLRSLGWPAATETCGVFRDRNFTTQSFEHLAGVRLADDAPVPRGLEIWSLPARTYLVFRQDLSDGELHPQVAAAQVEIWGARLGRSGRVLAKAPDFQIYPANFKVGVGGWLAYYVPVEA